MTLPFDTEDLTGPRRTLYPERVAYSNGMLLDDADFAAEQDYHRGQLGMVLRYLHGTGTIAGLNVEIDTAGEAPMVVVGPGLGLDRAGRILQNPLPLCLRLDRWWEDLAKDDASLLEQAFTTGSGDVPDHVLADVFLGFRECPVAKRPAFSHGDFDALGAVAPLRLRDAVEAQLVVRTEDTPPLPDTALPSLTGGNAAERRANLDAAKRETGWLEDDWWEGVDGPVRRGAEHPSDALAPDIFLARVTIPAVAGSPPSFNPDIVPVADNTARPMIYSGAELLALGA